MSTEFAQILKGLLDNRHLTQRSLSRASGRAESTINQLLSGRIAPTVEILQDIAPVLQMSVADLLVIADLPPESYTGRPGSRRATQEIGGLVAVASWLTGDQVEKLIAHAQELKAQNA